MSKGSKRRPSLAPRWLVELRWMLAYGRITPKEYARQLRKHDKKEHENGKP